MNDQDISTYTIERSPTTVQETLILQSAPLKVENLIQGATAQFGTSQLGSYAYNFEQLGSNVFRLVDIKGTAPAVQTLEVLRIEPEGAKITWRTSRWDVCHPVLDTASREQGGRYEVQAVLQPSVPAPLLRMSVPSPGNTAGKISMVGVYSNGASWFEEHAFRLGIGGSHAFGLTCTDDGLTGPVNQRIWTPRPDLGAGLVYQWVPNPELIASVELQATLHLHVQTFGPSNARSIELHLL